MSTRKKTSCAVLLIAALSCAPALAQSPVTSSGGPQEGIKVHGDWVIEVRNPDGGLAERREFKNALHTQGRTALAMVLGRQRSPGFWIVGVTGPSSSPCVGSPAGCGIYESLAGETIPNLAGASGNLQVTVVSGQIQLTGSVTATAATSITFVFTMNGQCPIGSTTPCLIAAPETGFFSTTAPNAFPPVNVVAGQIIQVTVTFSFS